MFKETKKYTRFSYYGRNGQLIKHDIESNTVNGTRKEAGKISKLRHGEPISIKAKGIFEKDLGKVESIF